MRRNAQRRSLPTDIQVLAIFTFIFFAVFAYLGWPALAQVPGPGEQTPVPEGPAANWIPLYLLVLGAATPLVGYVLNHFAPWASEQVKGIVQAVLAAGVAVLYQAVTPGDFGLNDETLLAVVTAMVGALLGHLGWSASGINGMLGAGTNVDGTSSKYVAGLSTKTTRRKR